MNIDDKSIEELDGQVWPEPEFSSCAVSECHRLRKIRIRDLTIEQLRLAFSQEIGTKFIKDRTIRELRSNPLVSGDFYEGDLLLSVMRSKLNGFERREVEELLVLAALAINLINDDETIKDEIAKLITRIRKAEPVAGGDATR